MTIKKAVQKIRKIKKSFKSSLIKIESISEWKVYEWYEIIIFLYKDKIYEYRATSSDAWIEKIKWGAVHGVYIN